MPYSADFQVFFDIFVHFYAFSGFFLKIHSHAACIMHSFEKRLYTSFLTAFVKSKVPCCFSSLVTFSHVHSYLYRYI